MSLEQFRGELELQIERLEKYSSAFRLAKDYELIQITGKSVVFWFESFGESGGNFKDGGRDDRQDGYNP